MSEFTTYLNDVFEHFGPIHTKRMFGGYGVYYQELMFGLVANDVLYLKADTESAELFEQLGLTRFEYTKQGKTMSMSYYMAPEEIYDDADMARIWAVRACEAALRSRKIITRSKKKK
jgi:DNA transformation protein and related proteins